MNTIMNTVLYNGMNASLMNNHNPELLDIKEHICGESKPIESTRRLYKDYSKLKKDIAENISMEHDIHECVLDNGNVMFAMKMHFRGIPCIVIPLEGDNNTPMKFVSPKNIMQPHKGSVVMDAQDIESQFSKCIDEDPEGYSSYKEGFKVLRSIPDDTAFRCVDKEMYMKHIANKVTQDELPPQNFIDDSNVGMAVIQRDNFETLRYSTAEGKLRMGPMNADDGTEILLCISEGYRRFEVYENAEDSDILEEFFICNKNSLSRVIPDIFILEATARIEEKMEDDEGRKSIKASKVSNSPLSDNEESYEGIPKKHRKRIRNIAQSARKLIAKIKRTNDDELREKLYNDEFIPLFDDFYEIIASAGVTAVGFAVLNPINGILLGILTFIAMNWKQRIDRRRVKELLDDKISALEEEIEDARTDGDLVKKRRLGEIKRLLERRRVKLTVGGSIASR